MIAEHVGIQKKLSLILTIKIGVNKMIYTTDHIGCYSDGTLGDTYLRTNLANIMRQHQQSHIARDIESWETHDEAINEAIEYLNEISSDDVEWVLDSGDLLLVKAEGSFHEVDI
jgi:hypothetical protein